MFTTYVNKYYAPLRCGGGGGGWVLGPPGPPLVTGLDVKYEIIQALTFSFFLSFQNNLAYAKIVTLFAITAS